MEVRLATFDNSWYQPGRGRVVRALWFLVNGAVMTSSWIPFSRLRCAVLRLFGARVGRGVVVKPGVSVKYPWNVEIGENSWIGEGAWLDSLGRITIGHDVCVSQGAYLCTGNHDWSKPSFDLIVKPITVEEGAWVGAKSVVLGGVTVARGSVLAAGAVLSRSTEPETIYQGNPAAVVRARWTRQGSSPGATPPGGEG